MAQNTGQGGNNSGYYYDRDDRGFALPSHPLSQQPLPSQHPPGAFGGPGGLLSHQGGGYPSQGLPPFPQGSQQPSPRYEQLYAHYPVAPPIHPPPGKNEELPSSSSSPSPSPQQQLHVQQQFSQLGSNHRLPSTAEQGYSRGFGGFYDSREVGGMYGMMEGMPNDNGFSATGFGLPPSLPPRHQYEQQQQDFGAFHLSPPDSQALPDLGSLNLGAQAPSHSFGESNLDASFFQMPSSSSSTNDWNSFRQPQPQQAFRVQGMLTLEELERNLMTGPGIPPTTGGNQRQGREEVEEESPFLASLNMSSAPFHSTTEQELSRKGDVSRLVSFGISLREDDSEVADLSGVSSLTTLTANPTSQHISEAAAPDGAAVDQEKEKEKAERKAARTARFLWQPVGQITVSPSQTGPNQYIQVNWTIPADKVSPSSYSREGSDPEELFDWVGLFRARTRVDATDGFILSRDVNGRSQLDRRGGVIHGSMRLRTPRGVGNYNFRYFKGAMANSKKEVTLPLARSNTVRVEVQGADMFEALDFVQRNLGEKKKLSNATMQFATLLRQLRTLRLPLQSNMDSGRNPRGPGRRPQGNSSQMQAEQERSLFRELWNTVGSCVNHVQRRCKELSIAIEEEETVAEERRREFQVINDYKEKLREEALEKYGAAAIEQALSKLEEDEDLSNSAELGMMSEEEFSKWKDAKDRLLAAERSLSQNVRDRATLSSSLRAVLVSFASSPAVGDLLGPAEKNQVERLLDLYCPVDEIFFSQPEALLNHYAVDLGMRFIQSPRELRYCPEFTQGAFLSRLQSIEREALILLPTLMPSPSMERDRLAFIDGLQKIVDETAANWGCDAKLVPFGSSINNFGNAKSDLDMCLVLIPRGASWPDAIHEDSPSEEDGAPSSEKAVTDLAETLKARNFDDVDDSRKTARIPIVQFHYKPLDLECDICVDNRLAIRNTLLLRTYSMVDPRLRQLAYIVKRWSKRRQINNPAQRTLSSYGYLLILIHFLQQLPIPLLPPLQALAPDWDGFHVSEEETNLPLMIVQSNDGKQHNTYFFGDPQNSMFSSPSAQQAALGKLQRFSARNQSTLSELLVRFFWFLAFGFDWRRCVIGIRDFSIVLKETKASEDSWKLHQRMAIEDPFETGYDVAHVVRDKEFKLMRREFVRAYAILAGCSTEGEGTDPTRLIEALCKERPMEE